jgi:hypothetical protein
MRDRPISTMRAQDPDMRAQYPALPYPFYIGPGDPLNQAAEYDSNPFNPRDILFHYVTKRRAQSTIKHPLFRAILALFCAGENLNILSLKSKLDSEVSVAPDHKFWREYGTIEPLYDALMRLDFITEGALQRELHLNSCCWNDLTIRSFDAAFFLLLETAPQKAKALLEIELYKILRNEIVLNDDNPTRDLEQWIYQRDRQFMIALTMEAHHSKLHLNILAECANGLFEGLPRKQRIVLALEHALIKMAKGAMSFDPNPEDPTNPMLRVAELYALYRRNRHYDSIVYMVLGHILYRYPRPPIAEMKAILKVLYKPLSDDYISAMHARRLSIMAGAMDYVKFFTEEFLSEDIHVSDLTLRRSGCYVHLSVLCRERTAQFAQYLRSLYEQYREEYSQGYSLPGITSEEKGFRLLRLQICMRYIENYNNCANIHRSALIDIGEAPPVEPISVAAALVARAPAGAAAGAGAGGHGAGAGTAVAVAAAGGAGGTAAAVAAPAAGGAAGAGAGTVPAAVAAGAGTVPAAAPARAGTVPAAVAAGAGTVPAAAPARAGTVPAAAPARAAGAGTAANGVALELLKTCYTTAAKALLPLCVIAIAILVSFNQDRGR